MTSPSRLNDSERLIETLKQPTAWPTFVRITGGVELIETHISWVLLTDDFAWKIKKPVKFDFLDFSTLERREYFCREELKLNRRFAPQLYLGLAAIRGTPEQPDLVTSAGAETLNAGQSAVSENSANRLAMPDVFEFAVQMRRFDQTKLLSRLAENGKLDGALVDELADVVAGFHARAERLPDLTNHDATATDDDDNCEMDDREWIKPLAAAAHENFDALQQRLDQPAQQSLLRQLEDWTDFELTSLKDVLQFRRKNGMVRNVHGDLHLGNIAIVDGKVCLFDCIEFNDDFRWIDVMSEVAFVVMDLEERGLTEFGWRFLNRYLERVGDYEGVRVLPFFLVYRALIRAKVDAIRLDDESLNQPERRLLREELDSCLETADEDHDFVPPALILMHGVSGSGKSYVAQHLLEKLPAVRVRSDVERKRLFDLVSEARPTPAQATEMYSAEASQRTYERLLCLADTLLLTGYPVIVDATFLLNETRQPFLDMAAAHCAKTIIVECTAPENILRQRVAKRLLANSDASDADVDVLNQQLPTIDRPRDAESAHVLRIDTTEADGLNTALAELRRLLAGQTAFGRSNVGSKEH